MDVDITDNAAAALGAVPGLRERAEEMLRGIIESAGDVSSACIDPGTWLRLHVGGAIIWYTLDLGLRLATIRSVRGSEEAA